jgi:hypothetical protein
MALNKEETMTPFKFIGSSTLAFAMSFAGCSADLATTPYLSSADAGRPVTQREAGELAFKYRQQALELRQMAQRLEMEAQWYGERFGGSDERAQDSRDKAKRLWTAAQEADQLVQEYGRQVPHGQVY